MRRNINVWDRIDKVSVGLFLLLVIMGWFNIYAAVYNEERSGILDVTQRYGKQFIWIVAAVVLAIFIVIIDSRFYFFFSWIIYGVTVFFLLLVLLFGSVVNGARSWFDFGSFSFQPSEFAKFGTALAIATYLSSRRQDLRKMRMILPAAAIIFLPAFLTALQPDMGSTIVYFSLFLVLFREGMSPYIFVSGLLMILLFFLTLLINNLYLSLALVVIAYLLYYFYERKWKVVSVGAVIFLTVGGLIYLLDRYVLDIFTSETILFTSLIIAGVVFAFYFYKKKAIAAMVIYLFLVGSIFYINTVDYTFNNVIQQHQRDRINILLGLKSDPHGTGYNVNQSIISVGSGGFLGKGFLKGTQTKFKFVPKQSSDFIFCTVGEEWGFIGSLVVIGLFLALLIRLIVLAERQRSLFSRVYGYGVASIIFIHFFINIGMAIGLVPVIGIPLPFFSYGGSSLWGFTALLFIFLRLDASRAEYLV
jgi:rod shape determining protein RodA